MPAALSNSLLLPLLTSMLLNLITDYDTSSSLRNKMAHFAFPEPYCRKVTFVKKWVLHIKWKVIWRAIWCTRPECRMSIKESLMCKTLLQFHTVTSNVWFKLQVIQNVISCQKKSRLSQFKKEFFGIFKKAFKMTATCKEDNNLNYQATECVNIRQFISVANCQTLKCNYLRFVKSDFTMILFWTHDLLIDSNEWK